MRYGKMPRLMWMVFKGSFERELPRMTEESPKRIMKAAAIRYRDILAPIPEFDSDDRFLVNILSASMLAAVYMELKEKPGLEQVTQYYHHAMTDNIVMKKFLKSKNPYTEKVQAMCTYDYEMAKVGGSVFIREYTLAGGGPCCDCHYRKVENC